MKSIDTLVADINASVGNMDEGASAPLSMGKDIMAAYAKQMCKRPPKVRDDKTLYFSEIGDPCVRRMWYKYHTPEVGEVLPANTRIKFLYGDMLESLVLTLTRDAGHTVEKEQESVEYVNADTGWRVRGRIDAVIDGTVVDVKSTTKFGEKKFVDGLVDDPFGYFGQLNGYATVLKSDQMGFLTIQKELGHIKYFPLIPDAEVFAHGFARAVKAVDRDEPIDKRIEGVPASATSPNIKLASACSYCPFKRKCFPDLRAFAYAGKVEYLIKVVNVPKVPEIDLDQAEGEGDE